MTKFVVAGNMSQEFKDKLAARIAKDVVAPKTMRDHWAERRKTEPGLVDVHFGVNSTWAVYHTGVLTSPYRVRKEPARPREENAWLFDTLGDAQRFAREQALTEGRR